MGQYFEIVNIDKEEYITPHAFGDGMKLLEFGSSSDGTMTALAILLRESTEGGGGDINSDNPIVGSWAGDRIVIAGDYSAWKWEPYENNLYDECRGFTNISDHIIEAMCDNHWLKEGLKERGVLPDE